MSQSGKSDNNSNKDKRRENIFEIMDNIIDQLNKTKKLFIIMILTIMIIPPIAFVATFALVGPPFQFERGPGNTNEMHNGIGPPGFGAPFGIARLVPILIVLVWVGIGIRQWFVLSKWSKKYERYKELQKSIDKKLDYSNEQDESKKELDQK
jgi:hypothetical protein